MSFSISHFHWRRRSTAKAQRRRDAETQITLLSQLNDLTWLALIGLRLFLAASQSLRLCAFATWRLSDFASWRFVFRSMKNEKWEMTYGKCFRISLSKKKGNERLAHSPITLLTDQFDLRRCRIASGNRRQDWLQRFC